eukprot:scaffold442992_cov22-Prasinocladus_malaysianus.AAC.1
MHISVQTSKADNVVCRPARRAGSDGWYPTSAPTQSYINLPQEASNSLDDFYIVEQEMCKYIENKGWLLVRAAIAAIQTIGLGQQNQERPRMCSRSDVSDSTQFTAVKFDGCSLVQSSLAHCITMNSSAPVHIDSAIF